MPEKMAARTKCANCPLRKMETFRSLNERELNFVSGFKTGELIVEAGSTIVLEDNNSPHLYTVLDGWAFRHKSLPDGRRQVLNFALPGDLVGLQLAVMNEMQHTVTALTDTTLCVFQRDKIWSVFKDYPSLSFSMTWIAAREEQMIDGHLVSLGRRSASERLAYLILHLHDRAEAVGYAGNLAFRAPFTQAHLSDALGITPVHMSRTVKKLQDKNLIAWKKDSIQILDRTALEALASYERNVKTLRPLI
ncbi:Crp/Fnr family transcriptional regulator [Labrenzia aggregata]|uniref:Crp/Fnr family transcriptional regulator n=2 Tax=Roseibium aggregatum TaxID=187304 RepID=A0A939EAZ8_9HYPH|nr:Crp/Fnr family transcriptional regulator [Roseibium aggregatum]